MMSSLTPYDLSFPKTGVPYAPTYANGHISATGDPIHFMFGSMVGFSGTADRTALFTVRTNPRWRPPPCWKNFKWPYLRNDYLYIAHRAVIFAIAQLSCTYYLRRRLLTNCPCTAGMVKTQDNQRHRNSRVPTSVSVILYTGPSSRISSGVF